MGFSGMFVFYFINDFGGFLVHFLTFMDKINDVFRVFATRDFFVVKMKKYPFIHKQKIMKMIKF